jgi:hypothetical protein
MTIELDDWDKDWLARYHTVEEYRRMCKELFERCAEYARQIDELKAARAPVVRDLRHLSAGCRYPDCTDPGSPLCAGEGRCSVLMAGGCVGPRKETKP